MTQHILEIQTGKHKGRKVRLKDPEIIVGRDEAAKIRIASKDVSRHHCSIQVRDDKVYVNDLKSSNGTFVNGKPLTSEVELLPGHTLTVGPMTFQLLGNSPTSPKKPKVAIGKKTKVDQKLSDDDIASWLVDDILEGQDSSDTTIIKDSATPATVPPPPPEPKEPKREFASVAEEANDIIRRHLEIVAEKTSGNG